MPVVLSVGAACAASARAGVNAIGVDSASAATGKAIMAALKKGPWKRINAKSSILLGRTDMGRIDHEGRQCAAKAIMDTSCELGSVEGAEKVEIPLFVPMAHHGEPVE